MLRRSTWTPPPRMRDLEPPPLESLRAVRVGVYVGSVIGKPISKENASQHGGYMAAAKALGYCMRCGIQGCALDFCHADLGKGQGLKTDVRRGWPGCRACHEAVGRQLIRPVRRAVEYLLGLMTRDAILAAGTWPKNLPMWKETKA